jgi:geranylgeranyl diphosphate synthase type II
MARSSPATSTTDAADHLAAARAAVDAALAAWFPRVAELYPGPVGRAIVYSLEGPGKRLRPALALAVFAELGGRGDASELVAAIEVVHTYSLIHDDLPCMDDDALRRGRPTVHRVFGAVVAAEAGFRMVPLAGRMLAAGCRGLGLDDATGGAIARTLYRAAGPGGMIGGQVLDLAAEGRTLERGAVIALHRAKTGAMIAASAEIGGLAAGLDGERLAAVRGYGEEIGLAFQIVDDVLDVVESSAQLGKTAGKDARQRKATFSALLGTDRALAEARAAVQRAVDRLGAAGIDSTLLPGLARFVVDRRS